MTVDPMSSPRFAGSPQALAANADLERAIDVLKAGFAEGRLTKAEHDERVAGVYAARTYGELGSLVADLPAGPLGGSAGRSPVALYSPVRPAVSSLAVAALACGIGVFLTSGLTAIPAIVLGHAARRAVRRTGERGAGMALTGLILGWGAIALIIMLAVLVITVSTHSTHGVVIHPGPSFPAFPGGPGGLGGAGG
jgi:hypothetical protein